MSDAEYITPPGKGKHETALPQAELKLLFDGITNAVRDPSQTRYLRDNGEDSESFNILGQISLSADDAKRVLDDDMAHNLHVTLIDPRQNLHFGEHRINIEARIGMAAKGIGSTLFGVRMWNMYRTLKPGRPDEYSLSKTPMDIEDDSVEIVILGPDDELPEVPPLTEEERDMKAMMWDLDTTIDEVDSRMLVRLIDVLKT